MHFPFWARLGTFGSNWAEKGRIGQNLLLSHSRRSPAISLPFGSALAATWQAGGWEESGDWKKWIGHMTTTPPVSYFAFFISDELNCCFKRLSRYFT
jgi:hypothetical protein